MFPNLDASLLDLSLPDPDLWFLENLDLYHRLKFKNLIRENPTKSYQEILVDTLEDNYEMKEDITNIADRLERTSEHIKLLVEQYE